MKHSKRFFLFSLAIIIGLGGAAATALAQNDTIVPLCYKNRNIKVPNYLVPRYVAKGATPGICPVTPP